MVHEGFHWNRNVGLRILASLLLKNIWLSWCCFTDYFKRKY